jgi:4-amino-4-deoxy-L-arabinose transferase-like glycosyltransferase
MEFIKKKSIILVIFGIIALYFFTRLYNLLSLPIFTDEAIYVRWAQIAGTDAAQRFISLTDGKQPSFVWLAAAFMKVVSDPLLASRLVSVFAGFGTLIGLFLLGQEIFKNRKIGLIVALVYVLYPFSLVYDRLAIYDSLVAMFIVWALFFEVLLVRNRRLDLALILGMIMGGGMLTKTSVNFALILLPFSLLLFDFKQKNWRRELGRFALLALVSVVIAYSIYSILRLSPYFYIIAQKNVTFVYPLREWMSHPFTFLIGNLKGLGGWLVDYVTIPFLILALSSFLVGKKYLREKVLLLIWFVAPFAALALFGKVIYPRFILFMTMPLIVLGSYALYHMVVLSKKNYIKLLIIITFLGTFVLNDFFILTDFSKAGIPQSDKAQLLASWPSGVGVNETVDFLRKESEDKLVYVGTEGTFGLMPYALEIYLKDNKNVEIQGFWPVNDNPPSEVLEKAKTMPTYFVFYQPCPSCPSAGLAPAAWPLEEVFKIKKVEKDSYYTLYEIKNP